MIDLKDWQKEAYESWIKNNYKGTIQAATGTGKTHIGLKAIEDFHKDNKILILVHTVHLLYQWQKQIQKFVGLEDIGLVGDTHFEFKNLTVAIINSVRAKNSYHELDLIIIDEMHHFDSTLNFALIMNLSYKKILGLSATPGLNNKLLETMPIIYNYSLKEAVDNNDLSQFKLIKRMIKLDGFETNSMNIYTETLKKYFPIYHYDLKEVKLGMDRKELEAFKIMRAVQKRRMIILNANERFAETKHLIIDHLQNKIIVFSEFISSAQRLKILISAFVKNIFIYHSKLSRSEKMVTLEKFKEAKSGVLISVKALDEGMDVPDVDVGIIMASTSVNRQMIQRVGRVLRKQENKVGIIYEIVAEDTQDEKWSYKRGREVRNASS